jgi:hypothetical protein
MTTRDEDILDVVTRFEAVPLREQGAVLLEAAAQMNAMPDDVLLMTSWTDFVENALDLRDERQRSSGAG